MIMLRINKYLAYHQKKHGEERSQGAWMYHEDQTTWPRARKWHTITFTFSHTQQLMKVKLNNSSGLISF